MKFVADSSDAQFGASYEALNLVRQPVWIFDIDRKRVHWANTAALKVWNAPTLQELCERDMGSDMSQSVAQRLAQYQSDFAATEATFHEQWTLYPAGVPISLYVTFSGHRLDDGRMAMLCEARTVTSDSPESLRSVEALLHTAVMISLYDTAGVPLYHNPAARACVPALGDRFESRVVDPQAFARLMRALEEQQSATFTLEVRTAQGERWHEISVRRCRDALTGHDAFLVSEVDVSALKRTEAQANFLAMHDVLTGLPNRAHVMRHFVAALADIGAIGSEAALVFIDLDHFKNINDTLGHAAGDELLVEIAKRLRGATRSTDLVARLGGDEFLILITSKEIQREVDRVRERIVRTIEEPVRLLGTDVRVTPSMGVSLYPRDGSDIETLLRNADLAMYAAKDRGRNDIAYYDKSMGAAAWARTALEADLRRALELDQFEVHYQPRVCVRTNRILGAEALVRWRHPERGLVRPDLFIPVCESTGLIRPLGLLVFNRAVAQQVAWSRRGHDLQVSVNLSPRQFSDPTLLGQMQDALEEAGCAAANIELEITESVLVGNDDRPAAILEAFVKLGMSIALDDFGTGYSNLAYLQRFPIHTLKIDKTFIQSIHTDRPLAELIVSLCRLMRLKVVAEGVETEEQLEWITRHGIEQYQGYLFAKPLPAHEFDALLDAQLLEPAPHLRRSEGHASTTLM